MAAQTRTIATEHGEIAVADSGGTGPAALLIHGNSSCKEIFRKQLEGAPGREFRLVAMDLPGHGRSSDAPEPERSYTVPGYAAAALAVLSELGIARAAVMGWSLGGHIGIEMMPRFPGMSGLMISGTPPVGKGMEALSLGFLPSEHMGLTSKEALTPEEALLYARAGAAPYEPFMLEAVQRTHGVARPLMFGAFLAGQGGDQREIVETSLVPLAIVQGAADPFINPAYFARVRYANLWDGKVHMLEGVGHAPFWQAPDLFDPLLTRFLGGLH